ncbi:MAG: MFS transporter [Leptospiraceae bacterium]|nr:MFS transporter [Leptospiraceae bacterium]
MNDQSESQKPVSSRKESLITMLALVLASAVYIFPYLKQWYHNTLLTALQIDNNQLGWLGFSYGIVAMICYFPGGWLADHFKTRHLLAVSTVTTGLAGLVFALFPPYEIVLVIHAFWGVSTILTFWAALIKATRHWASDQHQGRAFGFLEGGRGILEVLASWVGLGIFWAIAWLGKNTGQAWLTDTLALRLIIIIFSLLNLAASWICLSYIPDEADRMASLHSSSTFWRDSLQALRLPQVYLIALIILCGYAAFHGSFNTTPYAVDAFGTSDLHAAGLGSFRTIMRPIAAILLGLTADRLGIANTIRVLFGLLALNFLLLYLLPDWDHSLWGLWILTGILAFLIFAMRGIYYALLGESRVPLALTGMVTGIVSVIGYLPDVFMPRLSGWLLDNYPEAAWGHRLFFLVMVGLMAFGFIATITLQFMNRSSKYK